MKPEIVFFGEALPAAVLAAAEAAVRAADLLMVAGTSLAVYPAAALPGLRAPACRLAILNRGATPLDAQAHLHLQGAVGQALGGVIERMRAGVQPGAHLAAAPSVAAGIPPPAGTP
jgi:NAD-dependent deacetylase